MILFESKILGEDQERHLHLIEKRWEPAAQLERIVEDLNLTFVPFLPRHRTLLKG